MERLFYQSAGNVPHPSAGMVNNQLSSTEIEEYLNNPKTRYAVIQLLINKGKNTFYNKLSDDEIAASAVINFQSLKEKDAIILLDKQIISNNILPNVFFRA